eukprot:4913875-Amphidinium_carterae.1
MAIRTVPCEHLHERREGFETNAVSRVIYFQMESIVAEASQDSVSQCLIQVWFMQSVYNLGAMILTCRNPHSCRNALKQLLQDLSYRLLFCSQDPSPIA